MSNLNTFDCQVRSGNNSQHITGSFITPNYNNNIVSGLVSAINNMNPSNAYMIYSGQIPFMALCDNLPTNNTNPYDARNLPYIDSEMASLIGIPPEGTTLPPRTNFNNPLPFNNNVVSGFVSGINNTNPSDQYLAIQVPKTNIENYSNYNNYGNYNNLSFCWKPQKKYTL